MRDDKPLSSDLRISSGKSNIAKEFFFTGIIKEKVERREERVDDDGAKSRSNAIMSLGEKSINLCK